MNAALPTSRVSDCWLNGDQRLQELEHLAPGGANLSTYGYTYDVKGMIKLLERDLEIVIREGAATFKVRLIGKTVAKNWRPPPP